MEALVGEHVGYVQKLVKFTPDFLMASKCGVWGFIVPSAYPFNASFPISSAIINNMLGSLSVVFLFWLISQLKKKMDIKM